MADKETQTENTETVVIKKYANRRLYNTANSQYVTLEHLSEMVRQGVDFAVQDAKTSEDITRSVLTQIIFEQENRGQALLPVRFLRRLIRLYGDQMQGFLPAYLEASMETFTRGQEQMRDQFTRAWTGKNPMLALEEQTRQNMQMFEQAMRLWAPFSNEQLSADEQAAAAAPLAGEPEGDTLTELKRQMDQMQKQIEQLSSAKKGEAKPRGPTTAE